MIYLFLTNIGIDAHTIKEYGKGEFLGEITEQEWEQAEQIARMIDGKLFLGKTQAEKDEEQAREVRSKRDRLLSQTDWTLLRAMETGQNVPTEWSDYRQALRDITEQDGFPFNVIFPTPPQEGANG